MNTENELTLVPINDLLGQSFFIPAYQRGYRWTNRQITDLLNDVFDFIQQKKRAENEFYCLQPIVVRDQENRWELIDGQQRLTTIFLVLSFFNSRFEKDFRKELYSLEYETRPGSHDYLQNVDETQKEDNIDFHHIFSAYDTIKDWFSDKANRINDIESAFLNDVKVIWYDVREEIDPVLVFSRLNIGKIPLTNAELVKALFLKSSNFEGDGDRARYLNQIRIAQEWDDIERRLQDDEFWFFLSNVPTETNRIEFILKLRAETFALRSIPRNDPSFTYIAFNEHVKAENVHVMHEWAAVKRLFLNLDEWFRDRVLYHLVGFLISQGESINDLQRLSEKSTTKSNFKLQLKGRIASRIISPDISIDSSNQAELTSAVQEVITNLDYDNSKNKIRATLLLFNIATIVLSIGSNARFAFNLFKQENWDIEHIRSVHSEMPLRPDAQKRWLDNVLRYATGKRANKNQSKAIENMCESDEKDALLKALAWREDASSEDFELLFVRIINEYDPDSDPDIDNSIGNLTLLDAETNRSYKNSIFPIKRLRLIALDKSGTFVPLCTKNVFLKYYSPEIKSMLAWASTDSEGHRDAIVSNLTEFFGSTEISA